MGISDAQHYQILSLADNSLILGQRLSEMCGHCAKVEIDLAVSNIALDLLGQSRFLYQYLEELTGRSEDSYAMLRSESEYVNILLVEQQNENFAQLIVRQYLFDHYYALHLQEIANNSNDERLIAFAKKTIKENTYHKRFSKSWLLRLGDGTEESHNKTQEALQFLTPYIDEMVSLGAQESSYVQSGEMKDLVSPISDIYYETLVSDFKEATLEWQKPQYHVKGGKDGRHSEHMGYILADLQFMQRAYPDANW